MNKRKNRAFYATFIVLLIMLRTSALLFSVFFRYPYGDKNIAVQIDTKNLSQNSSFMEETENIIEYFEENDVNTAVVVLSDEDYIDGNILRKLNKALKKKKIETFFLIDCSKMSDDGVIMSAEYLHKEYKPDGIVFDNFAGDDDALYRMKNVLRKGRNTSLVIQAENSQVIENFAENNAADLFICENITADEYTMLKKAVKEKILLHCMSPSMESNAFLLTRFSEVDGAVVAEYDPENTGSLMLDTVFRKKGKLPSFNLTVSTDFNITYPLKDFTTYYKGIFITGTGEPYGTVSVNGTEYRSEKDGTFGIYRELEEGENALRISQNGQTKKFTVTRKVYKSTGVKYELPEDNTIKLEYGQAVRTTGELTSMLSDPDYDSAIIAGMEKGTKLKVTGSVQTSRNSTKTYAYKLSNGGYVLADKVELLNNGDFTSKITSAEIKKLSGGDEILTVFADNRPAVITDFQESSLTLHFLDAQVGVFEMPESDFYVKHKIYQKDDGAYIDLKLNSENMLWGYDVNVTEDKVIIYLKKTPQLKRGAKPLDGVTVMLDAGHGGYDSGALGVASTFGPLEKDVNLAVAQAAKELLQEFGANVFMTREDDSFPSLDDRRNMTRNIKPDLFIAVHHNSMDYSYNSTNAVGSECYYFTKQSKRLADLMCENVTAATDRLNRGSKVGYYYVTRTDIAPAVLMEYSFIINPKDYSTTYNDTDIYKAAFGTLQAVLKAIPD